MMSDNGKSLRHGDHRIRGLAWDGCHDGGGLWPDAAMSGWFGVVGREDGRWRTKGVYFDMRGALKDALRWPCVMKRLGAFNANTTTNERVEEGVHSKKTHQVVGPTSSLCPAANFAKAGCERQPRACNTTPHHTHPFEPRQKPQKNNVLPTRKRLTKFYIISSPSPPLLLPPPQNKTHGRRESATHQVCSTLWHTRSA